MLTVYGLRVISHFGCGSAMADININRATEAKDLGVQPLMHIIPGESFMVL